MRSCPCCRMPAPVAALHPGEIHNIGVLLGLCARCARSNDRLPHGTAQKRLNAAASLAAGDTTGRYWTARFPDHGAAVLAAHLIGCASTRHDALEAIGWR